MEYIFELPIYSMSKKRYKKKMELKLKSEIARYGLTKDNPNYDIALESIKKSCYREWKYNAIIGYIRFFFKNFSLMGDIWLIQQKRIPLVINKKNFTYYICYPEWDIHFSETQTSKEIFKILEKEIPNELTGVLDKYYIDMSFIKIFGKYIKWKDFLI